MNRLNRLRKALQQWKCPSCGGSGTYEMHGSGGREYRKPHQKHAIVMCKKCGGSGLHPIASEALSKDGL